MRGRLTGLLSLLQLLALLARPAAAWAAEPVSLKVGTIRITADAGIFLAIERGYFREEGLAITLEPFDTAAKQIAPLAVGQIHVGVGAISAGLFNAVARNIDMKIVAEKGSSNKDRSASALAVRKDLVDSGRFRGYADLRGLTIALSALAASPQVELYRALERGRVPESEVRLVPMAFPDMVTAFKNRAIDAAIFQEPLTTLAVEMGLIVRWALSYEFYPDHTVGVLLYSPKLTTEHPEPARRFMVAYLRGARDYAEAFVKNRGRPDVVRVLVKYTTVKNPALFERMVPAGLHPDGQLNLTGIQYDLDWYTARGLVKSKVDLARVIDLQYLGYALKRLGSYQW